MIDISKTYIKDTLVEVDKAKALTEIGTSLPKCLRVTFSTEKAMLAGATFIEGATDIGEFYRVMSIMDAEGDSYEFEAEEVGLSSECLVRDRESAGILLDCLMYYTIDFIVDFIEA